MDGMGRFLWSESVQNYENGGNAPLKWTLDEGWGKREGAIWGPAVAERKKKKDCTPPMLGRRLGSPLFEESGGRWKD